MDGDKVIHSRISSDEWLIINVLQKTISTYENNPKNISGVKRNNQDKDSSTIMLSESGYFKGMREDDEVINKFFVAYTNKEVKGKRSEQGMTYINFDPRGCVNDWVDYIIKRGFDRNNGLHITRGIKELNRNKPKPITEVLINQGDYTEIICKGE